MKEYGTINFFDAESKEAAVIVFRGEGEKTWLCLSVETGGDVEVCLDRNTTERLLEVFTKSLVETRKRDS
jgi:hypothetical protein